MDLPPIPQPPGTPIPPTPLPDGSSAPSPFYPQTDMTHLAPNDSGRRGSLAFMDSYGTPPTSPRFAPSPLGTGSPPIGTGSGGSGGGEAQGGGGGGSPGVNPMRKTPFNFQQSFASKGPVLSKPAQRRGHRYKHSSISLSHSIIQEPPPRAPLSLPASLPLPTSLECMASITPQQRLRCLWCLTHILIGTFVLWSAAGSLALTALSHVILFDAFSSTVCVAVDVLSNFEVWKRSTIRHPFGLERAEVLAGFAMSVFLVFMGLDIISHTAEHLLEGFQSFAEIEGEAGEEPHDHHSHHSRVPPGSIDLASLLAIISTLTSALLLQNHTRIGKAMRIQAPSFIPFVPKNSLLANNPSHLLTLIFATFLLILPLLNVTYYSYLDRFLALAISCCMLLMGARLIKSLGSMLLMSYYTTVPGVVEGLVRAVESGGVGASGVKRVVECKIWQVHYGLGMAGFKVVIEPAAEEGRVRERIGRVVKDRLGGVGGGPAGEGGGGVRWEVSVAVVVD